MDRLTKGNGECSWALHNGLWLEPYELASERDNVHTVGNLMRRLAKYENTDHTPEEIQNAIFPPCKVGDTVYYLTGNPTLANGRHFNRVESTRCIGFYWDERGLQIRLYIPHGSHGTYGYYGDTIFLTREEAEAALGGGGE